MAKTDKKLVKRLKLLIASIAPAIFLIGYNIGSGSVTAAASAGANVVSIDNYSSITFDDIMAPFYTNISNIRDLGLINKIRLIEGNTKNYENYELKSDILFIDGDHSYEGVKADYEHWIHTLKEGGSLLFHDSCKARENATIREDVARFMKEIPYKLVKQVGSLSHFIKEVENGKETKWI